MLNINSLLECRAIAAAGRDLIRVPETDKRIIQCIRQCTKRIERLLFVRKQSFRAAPVRFLGSIPDMFRRADSNSLHDI